MRICHEAKITQHIYFILTQLIKNFIMFAGTNHGAKSYTGNRTHRLNYITNYKTN